MHLFAKAIDAQLNTNLEDLLTLVFQKVSYFQMPVHN